MKGNFSSQKDHEVTIDINEGLVEEKLDAGYVANVR